MSIFYGRKKGLIVLGFGSALYYFSDKIFIQSNKASHFNLIKKDIEQMLWNSNYEDGHIGPLLIRLAWHASGTYDKESNTGGSNGSTMRFQLEANDGANAGLEHARKFMDTLKTKYPNVSYADLWIYASYVAIENMGGPSIPFAYGRVDFTDESKVPPNGRLPNASLGRSHIRDVFYRMG